MLQKILKVGNSAGVTIPADYFNKLKLKIGSFVELVFDEEEKVVKINPNPQKTKKSISSLKPEFIAWADKFIEDNKKLFKELANQ